MTIHFNNNRVKFSVSIPQPTVSHSFLKKYVKYKVSRRAHIGKHCPIPYDIS